jgi:hypothetical protein
VRGMRKIKLFIRKLIYATRKVIPAIIKEFNNKDGYSFRTNFVIDDEPFYRKTLDKLGADYRISNYATDSLDRPLKWHHALYIKGDYNHTKFMELYMSYSNEKRKRRFKI